MNNTYERVRIGEHVSIRQRGVKNIWIAEFSAGGRHCRRSLKTAKLSLAERRAQQLEVDLVNGHYRELPKAVEIETAIQQFVDSKKLDHCSRKTLVKYEAELKTAAAFFRRNGVIKLHQISPRLHDLYRGERLKNHSPYTVHNHAIILKGFVRWCESRDLISTDPLRKVRLSKPVRSVKYSPTLTIIKQLLTNAEPSFARQIALLAFTGMRLGEMQMLRRADVDLDENWIHITIRQDWTTKTKVSRKIPIHDILRPYLLEALTQSRGKPFVFCAPASRLFPKGDHRINPRTTLTQFQELAKKLNLPVGHRNDGLVVHSLRHFMETFCINNGIPQRAVDVWLGHVGARTTAALYYQLSEEESQSFMKTVPFNKHGAIHPHTGEDHVE